MSNQIVIRPGSSTDSVGCFKNLDAVTPIAKFIGGREPRQPCSDDSDGLKGGRNPPPLSYRASVTFGDVFFVSVNVESFRPLCNWWSLVLRCKCSLAGPSSKKRSEQGGHGPTLSGVNLKIL